jgi:hypothetical protein
VGLESGWVAERSAFGPRKVYRKVRAYRTLHSDDIPWQLEDGTKRYTRGYHRPLNWYAKVLSSNGLAIMVLEEPEATAEFHEEERRKVGDLDSPGILEVPLHLVFEAVKLPTAFVQPSGAAPFKKKTQ